MGVFDLICKNRHFRQALSDSRQRLYRMALAWTREPALADDLVQEAMSRGLKNAQQLRDPERMNAWMFRILTNVDVG